MKLFNLSLSVTHSISMTDRKGEKREENKNTHKSVYTLSWICEIYLDTMIKALRLPAL